MKPLTKKEKFEVFKRLIKRDFITVFPISFLMALVYFKSDDRVLFISSSLITIFILLITYALTSHTPANLTKEQEERIQNSVQKTPFPNKYRSSKSKHTFYLIIYAAMVWFISVMFCVFLLS